LIAGAHLLGKAGIDALVETDARQLGTTLMVGTLFLDRFLAGGVMEGNTDAAGTGRVANNAAVRAALPRTRARMANLPFAATPRLRFCDIGRRAGRFSALMVDLFGTAEKRLFLRAVARRCRLVAKADGPPAGTTIVICSASTHAMNLSCTSDYRSTSSAAAPDPNRDTYGDTYVGAAVK
jgi:hypothetical protein